MDLQGLETRIQEIDQAIHELLQEIDQMKAAESGNSRQVEIARRMRLARDAMAPLGMSVKDLVEEGRER